MGHGILSGSPFHMIGGWATDMSVDYAELHRGNVKMVWKQKEESPILEEDLLKAK